MRSFLLPLAFLFGTVSHAQIVTVYGTFADTHLSGLVDGTTGNVTSGYTSATTSHWTPGVGVGATFGVLPVGPIHLGLDVRGSFKPGNDSSDLIVAGPRLGIKLPVLRLKPYIQLSGGYLRTRTTLINSSLPAGTQLTASYAAYEVLGGIDYPIAPFIDFRVIELGGGQGISAFSSGPGSNVSLFTVNSGLTVHF